MNLCISCYRFIKKIINYFYSYESELELELIPVPFWELDQQNDIRKYGYGKRMKGSPPLSPL